MCERLVAGTSWSVEREEGAPDRIVRGEEGAAGGEAVSIVIMAPIVLSECRTCADTRPGETLRFFAVSCFVFYDERERFLLM